jgi:hypothetical protein
VVLPVDLLVVLLVILLEGFPLVGFLLVEFSLVEFLLVEFLHVFLVLFLLSMVLVGRHTLMVFLKGHEAVGLGMRKVFLLVLETRDRKRFRICWQVEVPQLHFLLLAEDFISAYLQYTNLLPEHYNANLQFFRPLLSVQSPSQKPFIRQITVIRQRTAKRQRTGKKQSCSKKEICKLIAIV